MRKLFIAAAMVLILGILPAISWIYLRNGLNWRREAIAELGQYGKIRGAYMIYDNNEKINRIAGSVCVIHNFGDAPTLTSTNRRIIDDCEKLYQQFGTIDGVFRPGFNLVMVSENPVAEFKSYYQKLPSSDYATWVWTGGLGSWRTILENGYNKYCYENKLNPAAEYYALSDTSGQIRRFYNAESDKEVRRLVEHIAMLLPKLK